MNICLNIPRLFLLFQILSIFIKTIYSNNSSNCKFMLKKPKLVAFDLDGTIWSPDMYELWGGGSPFTAIDDGKKFLRDSSGTTVRLLGITGHLLHELKFSDEWRGVKLAWVSKTDEPLWANECLQKFKSSGGAPLISLADSSQIYKGNKQEHFRNLKREYPDIDFANMIFFDNEMGNIRDVSKIGVCSVYCPDGVTKEIWDEGLKLFNNS